MKFVPSSRIVLLLFTDVNTIKTSHADPAVVLFSQSLSLSAVEDAGDCNFDLVTQLKQYCASMQQEIAIKSVVCVCWHMWCTQRPFLTWLLWIGRGPRGECVFGDWLWMQYEKQRASFHCRQVEAPCGKHQPMTRSQLLKLTRQSVVSFGHISRTLHSMTCEVFWLRKALAKFLKLLCQVTSPHVNCFTDGMSLENDP